GLGAGFERGAGAGLGVDFAASRGFGTTTGADTSCATAGAAGGAAGCDARGAGCGCGCGCGGGGSVALGTAWTTVFETVGGVASLGVRTCPPTTRVAGSPTAPASAAMDAAAVTRRIQFPLMLRTPSADDSHVGHRQTGPE